MLLLLLKITSLWNSKFNFNSLEMSLINECSVFIDKIFLSSCVICGEIVWLFFKINALSCFYGTFNYAFCINMIILIKKAGCTLIHSALYWWRWGESNSCPKNHS